MKKLTESRGEISFHGGFLANLVYVGDLCYCLNDAVYQEAIKLADYEGKFDSTVSGMHVEGAFVSTQYGDGSYIGSDSREYAVDAGIIGIVNITSAAATEGEDFESFSKLGRVIKLPKYGPTQYEISRDEDGTITVEIRQGKFKEVIAIVTGDTEEEEEEEDTEICPCCGAEYDGYECTCCGYPESFGDDEEEFEESVINEAESGPTSLKKAAEKKSIKDWIDSEMTDEIKDDVYEFIKGSDKYYLNDFVTYNQFEKIMFSNGFDDQDYMWKPLIEK